jgi:hypothetical protein
MPQEPSELMDAVRVAIASLTSPWTIEQVASEVGASPDEVRSCVARLIDGGTIEDLGDDPRHDGDGPAPRLYGPPSLEDAPDPDDITLD